MSGRRGAGPGAADGGDVPGGSGSGAAPGSVVVDTNIFVGAGFSPRSASARVVDRVRDGSLRMPWTDATRGEVETVLRTIPPLDWPDFRDLFRDDARFEAELDEDGLDWIPDPSDRKFAALAREAGATLVSNDRHLLDERERAGFAVVRPGEFTDGHPKSPRAEAETAS